MKSMLEVVRWQSRPTRSIAVRKSTRGAGQKRGIDFITRSNKQTNWVDDKLVLQLSSCDVWLRWGRRWLFSKDKFEELCNFAATRVTVLENFCLINVVQVCPKCLFFVDRILRWAGVSSAFSRRYWRLPACNWSAMTKPNSWETSNNNLFCKNATSHRTYVVRKLFAGVSLMLLAVHVL